VIPAEQWAQDRSQKPDERLIGEDAPVEANVNLAIPRCERPDRNSAQIALDLRFEFLWTIDEYQSRGGLEDERKLALEPNP
jgi:hypothetical protein